MSGIDSILACLYLPILSFFIFTNFDFFFATLIIIRDLNFEVILHSGNTGQYRCRPLNLISASVACQ